MLKPEDRKREFERMTGRILYGNLGVGIGQDGFVCETPDSAAKFFDRADRFQRELEVYKVLRDKNIHEIGGHNIPRLIGAFESIQVIEMSIVSLPFLLDFAGAKLPHEVPDFPEDIMQEHYDHLKELYGDRWTDALRVAEKFRLATGFTLLDIHPGNIAFLD